MSRGGRSGLLLGVQLSRIRLRGEAAAAEVEEVIGGSVHRGSQDLEPQLGDPGLGLAELDVRALTGRGQRPGKGVSVDLARRAGRQGVDDGQPWDERRRKLAPQSCDRATVVDCDHADLTEPIIVRGRNAQKLSPIRELAGSSGIATLR